MVLVGGMQPGKMIKFINKHMGDKTHRKTASAIDFDVWAFTERKAFASSRGGSLYYGANSVFCWGGF